MNNKRFLIALYLFVWFSLCTSFLSNAQQRDQMEMVAPTLKVRKHNVNLQIGMVNMLAIYQTRTGKQQLFEVGIGYGTSLLPWYELTEKYDGPIQRIRGPKGLRIPDIYLSAIYFAGYRYYFRIWADDASASSSNSGIYAGIKARGTGSLRLEERYYQPFYSGNIHLGLQLGWGKKSRYCLNFQAGPGIQFNQNFTRYAIVPAGSVLFGINLFQQD